MTTIMLFWRLQSLGLDKFEASFHAKWHPAAFEKLFQDADKQFEERIAKKRGRCRICKKATKGLSLFCEKHRFTKERFNIHLDDGK